MTTVQPKPFTIDVPDNVLSQIYARVVFIHGTPW